MPKRVSVLILISLALAAPLAAQLVLPRPSPKATVTQTVGLTDVTVTYSRPSVRGRAIWGELVPYGQVWRTGANEATTIAFKSDVTIGNEKLAAGTYSLHAIPGKDEWTVIFNSVADQWGSYSYDAAKDTLRVRIKPETGAMQELLTISFPAVSMDGATMAIEWEKVRVAVPFKVDSMKMAYDAAKAAVAKLDDWRTPYQAANFAYQNKANWQDSMAWVDKSIAIQGNFANLTLKARMLADSGKTSEAITVAEQAVKLGKASTQPVDTSATEKLIVEWKARK